MQNLPEVGKIYISRTDPTCLIYVEDVMLIEADGDEPATFHVEGCDAKDKGDETACGIEFTGDEWLEHDFIPHSQNTPAPAA